MLLRAAKDLNIDLSKSYMIGDGENDVNAGIVAWCKTVLISDVSHLTKIYEWIVWKNF